MLKLPGPACRDILGHCGVSEKATGLTDALNKAYYVGRYRTVR